MSLFSNYAKRLNRLLAEYSWENVQELAETLHTVWKNNNRVFVCGNGGSAANAIHLVNDLVYGTSPGNGNGLKAQTFSSNQSVITCLANDLSYDDIFSYQLSVQGKAGDILLTLSGSGNSPNIIKVIQKAKEMNIASFAILGFSGGKALKLAGTSIHFPIDDMQISEDCQQIVGHMLMNWLKENPVS